MNISNLFDFITDNTSPASNLLQISMKENIFLSNLLICYGLKSLESDNRTTLVLSNIRELNRVSSTK